MGSICSRCCYTPGNTLLNNSDRFESLGRCIKVSSVCVCVFVDIPWCAPVLFDDRRAKLHTAPWKEQVRKLKMFGTVFLVHLFLTERVHIHTVLLFFTCASDIKNKIQLYFSEILSGKSSLWPTILIRAPKSQPLRISRYVIFSSALLFHQHDIALVFMIILHFSVIYQNQIPVLWKFCCMLRSNMQKCNLDYLVWNVGWFRGLQSG